MGISVVFEVVLQFVSKSDLGGFCVFKLVG